MEAFEYCVVLKESAETLYRGYDGDHEINISNIRRKPRQILLGRQSDARYSEYDKLIREIQE